MLKKLKFVFCTLILTVSLGLVGCQQGVSDIPALTLEEVAGTRLATLTAEEKEGAVYKFVSNRIVVDKDRLIEISQKDLSAINMLLSNVNEFLKGERNNVLIEEYGNYLLMEFAKTPYEWQQTKVEPVGFDPAARLYFIDVTYTTTDTLKNAIPSSKIVNGSPNEQELKQKRYADYIMYLSTLQKGNIENAEKLLETFINRWGTVEHIMWEQQGVSLLDRTRSIKNDTGGIGKLTYSGLVSYSKLNVPATMTFRYVLKYNFNLGEETDLGVMSVYLKSYSLDNADNLLSSYRLNDPAGIEVLKPFIDQLINSYHKAVEESNAVGLYQLFENYGAYDKYYDDIRDYSYLSTGSYTYKILERSGTNVAVQVNRVNQIRARGAEISLPTYDEVVVFHLVLSPDDKIRIKSVTPVKIEMIGEPLSVIKNVSGISDIIQYSDVSFTDTNKEKVEETLKAFSKVVLNQQIDTSDFINIIDLGVSQVTLQKIVNNITSINADKKTTYIVSWDTKSNVYCSLTIREIFEGRGGNFDTEAVVDLINRNGEWKVVDYTRTINVKTNKPLLDTKNALCVDDRTVNSAE